MLRLRSSARFALPFVALTIITACVDNGRDPELSQVEPVPDASTPTNSNVNISDPTLTIPDSDPIDPGDDLVLIFSDEFNGAALDPETWFFATGRGEEFGLPAGWGNNELQYYLPDNAQLENGLLKITAKRESFGGQPYTSARINTRDRFAFQYGRIEASIKLPKGQGIWPAFWMLAQDSPYGNWAATGEIDIVEAVNLGGTPRPDNPDADGGDNKIFGTIYYGGEAPNQQSSSETYVPSVDVSAGFNTYAVEWDVSEIRWYFNDTLYATQNMWSSAAAPFPAPFDQPFYILFNVAVGGNFPGLPDEDTEFPVTMEVDWVRVYKGEAPPAPPNHGPGTASIFTETTTESAITVTGYTNSADFGGNSTVADPMSTTIPAFEGSVSLAVDYQNTVGNFGGVLLNFGGVDLTAYDTLNFTIDSSAIAGFADLTLQIEPPGGPQNGNNVFLSSYTPVATSGNWVSYQVPLSDFPGSMLDAAGNLGFWNPRDGSDALVYGVLYLDDIYLSTESSGGGGGNLAVNGGFEEGTFNGWTQFEITAGDQTINTGMAGDTSSEGTRHLEIRNTVSGTNSLIKQERVGQGTVTPGIGWTVTFDARGSFDPGGVSFAQVFSETAGGPENCTGCGILGGAPLMLNADPEVWTPFSFSGTAGPNTESLTLQLEAVTGGGSLANVFFDNITIVVN